MAWSRTFSALLIDRGLPASEAVAVTSARGGASLAGRLLTGSLIGRFDAMRPSFLLLAIAAVGVYLVAGTTSFSTGAIAALCIGFGTDGDVDVIPYLYGDFGIQSLATLFRPSSGRRLDFASAAGPIWNGARGRGHRLLCEYSVCVGCRHDRGRGTDALPAGGSAPAR